MQIYAPPMPSAGSKQPNPQTSPVNHYLINKQQEERKRDPKGFIHKLAFSRAISEPPSGNKNAVMPVTEDQNDDESSDNDIGRNYRMGTLEEVQEEDHRMSRGPRVSNGKDKPNQEKTVPPLQISQIH